MTALDIWLHLCGYVVFFAMLEYAILLKIRFGKDISDKAGQENYRRAAWEKCRKIDHYAMIIFPIAFGLSNFVYFYKFRS